MLLRIQHKTRYQYDAGVGYGLQQLRLLPATDQSQWVKDWQVSVTGGNEELRFTDHNNNQVLLVSYQPGTNDLEIVCQGEVSTKISDGIYGKHDSQVPLWYYQRHSELTEAGTRIKELVRQLGTAYENELAMLHALSMTIGQQVRYGSGSTSASTGAEAALASGQGVCQDHAHIFVSAARVMGFPARYISGYLMMKDRVDQDASHAWAEVHLAGLGWVGFDVSNGISPDQNYIRIAVGLDYREAAPVSGMRYGNSKETMAVSVQVQQ